MCDVWEVVEAGWGRQNGGRRGEMEDRSREGGCGHSPVLGRENGGMGHVQEGEVEREAPEIKCSDISRLSWMQLLDITRRHGHQDMCA